MHLDGILFALLIGVAGLLRILAKKAGETNRPGPPSRSNTPPRANLPPPRPEISDEERIRRFMEALGQPPSSRPPEPVRQRPTYQRPIVARHVPPFPSPLPPLTARPLPEPELVVPAAPVAAQMAKPVVPESPVFETYKSVRPEEQPIDKTGILAAELHTAHQISDGSIASLLRSSTDLRNAIILREIFGAPRSLQPFDLVGSA